jgi:hypothetical protein
LQASQHTAPSPSIAARLAPPWPAASRCPARPRTGAPASRRVAPCTPARQFRVCLSLHAAHKAEQNRLFNVIAGKVFALFERVPALRSVIAHLRRNLAINAAERHRLENEALDRRHDREDHIIDRRAAALDKINAYA